MKACIKNNQDKLQIKRFKKYIFFNLFIQLDFFSDKITGKDIEVNK